MKNCVNQCGTVCERPHCQSPTCTWFICEKCEIVFDPIRGTKRMKWLGKRSA